eukprot:7038475-Alexandrium_andersonii.AAC.1
MANAQSNVDRDQSASWKRWEDFAFARGAKMAHRVTRCKAVPIHDQVVTKGHGVTSSRPFAVMMGVADAHIALWEATDSAH